MVAEVVTSMLTAAVIIFIILISGGFRAYFRHKFDVSEHIESVAQAARRQQNAKTRLQNVQNH